jgi:hypothetical protein
MRKRFSVQRLKFADESISRFVWNVLEKKKAAVSVLATDKL